MTIYRMTLRHGAPGQRYHMVDLEADDATLDFTTIYASGRSGIATTDLKIPPQNLKPLFDAIMANVPAPEVEVETPLQMLVCTLDYSDYVGRIAIGRVFAGKIRKGQRIALLRRDSPAVHEGMLSAKSIPHAQRATLHFEEMWNRSREIADFRELRV